MVSVLSVPCCHRLLADGIKLVVPNQEVKMILKLKTSKENLKLTMKDILENNILNYWIDRVTDHENGIGLCLKMVV